MPYWHDECGLSVFLYPRILLYLGFHKRRAAHAKIIKVIILLRKHGLSSFCVFVVIHYTLGFFICQ